MDRPYDVIDGIRYPNVSGASIETLRNLAADIQELLWLTDVGWDAGKELDSDTLGYICEIMGNHGLAPSPDTEETTDA